MLCYNVYTIFHEVWITHSETELGRGGDRDHFFPAHHTLYEPWADSISCVNVESFQIIILLQSSAVEINEFMY